MATKFVKQGTCFKPTSDEALDIHEKLPPGNYTVKSDPFGNLFFETVDSFELPEKLYGDCTAKAERIMHTFEDRQFSTGVLLVGEKGSGKTLLAKKLSCDGAAKGYPTIIINDPFCGDSFNELIQSVQQNAIVIFDEFEKVYEDTRKQEAILTLLDGVFQTKKLFIFTSNNKWKINQHMTNRPGRLFYALEYKGLDCNFVKEYCEDNMKNKQHIAAMCTLSSTFEEFNFDILKAMVEECNRYDEDPFEAVKMLNASPAGESSSRYTISLIHKGKEIKNVYAEEGYSEFRGNPLLKSRIKLFWNSPQGRRENEMFVTYNDLVKVDQEEGIFIYKQDGNTTVTFTRKKAESFSYQNLAGVTALGAI